MPTPRGDRRPAVFFDRDDTLIHCTDVTPDGDLGDPALVRLLPGALECCQRLKNAGYALAVASNQGGVARGRYGLDQVGAVNDRVNQLLGGLIDAFRFCPYHPKGIMCEFTREHPWRKPAPGMLLDVAEALNIDLERSWMVGDRERDIEAGAAAGCRTILLYPSPSTPGWHERADVSAFPPTQTSANHTVPSLTQVATLILSGGSRA